MRYYGILHVAMVTLIMLVVVKDGALFADPFFGVYYMLIGAILVIGAKFNIRYAINIGVGAALLVSVTLMFLYVMLTMKSFTPHEFFQLILLVILNLAALAFLSQAKEVRRMEIAEARRRAMREREFKT